MTSSYLDRLAPHLAAALPDALQSFVAESIELVKVTFGQSWTFLGALASALPASVVVSLVYRLSECTHADFPLAVATGAH